ncbi:MAG: 50S ribosomal protein L11 methyltransferase [Pseudomonadota bacterium]
MAWVQLRLNCEKHQAEAAEDALIALGALSVTLQDSADQPLLEPKVGETPLWNAVRVTGLFSAECPLVASAGIGAGDHLSDEPAPASREPSTPGEVDPLSALRQFNQGAPPRLDILEDKDWSRAWMEHYRPMRFGRRLWICPSWQAPPQKDAINLMLDPGLAFGTGTHPSTAMCLKALDHYVSEGDTVVDYGCGSGILGIAAVLLGAERVLCVDYDPQALDATRSNARRNGVADSALACVAPEAEVAEWIGSADVVVANILATPLAELVNVLCNFLRPNGTLILAGILDSQANYLCSLYAARIALQQREQHDEWVCLAGALSG